MSPFPVTALVVAASTLSAPAAAEPASGRMRITARVVRTCQVASGPSHARVRCGAREGQVVHVQVDRQAPSLHRAPVSDAVAIDVRAARRMTIDF